MTPVRSATSYPGDNGPAVGQQLYRRLAGIHHRFHRQGHTGPQLHAGAGAALRTVPSSAELPLLVFFKKGSAPAGGADSCEASVRANDAASVESYDGTSF